MKRVLTIILSLIILQLPSFAANKKMIPTSSGDKNQLPNIFIYAIPDDENKEYNEDLEQYIQQEKKENEDAIFLEDDNLTLSATTLKGYAQFIEDDSVVHLKDNEDNFVLNIKVPQKISASKGLNLKKDNETKPYLKYKEAEYAIAPSSIKTFEKNGNFTFGALYGNEVDNIAMLETETGLFTKYEKDRFALSTSYKKNLNTTYSLFYDTISIAPEFKLNNYMSVKNEYKADITRNRNSGSLVLSLNPFGKKDLDRMRLEVGAKQTVYMDTDFTKTEFSFSTRFKL